MVGESACYGMLRRHRSSSAHQHLCSPCSAISSACRRTLERSSASARSLAASCSAATREAPSALSCHASSSSARSSGSAPASSRTRAMSVHRCLRELTLLRASITSAGGWWESLANVRIVVVAVESGNRRELPTTRAVVEAGSRELPARAARRAWCRTMLPRQSSKLLCPKRLRRVKKIKRYKSMILQRYRRPISKNNTHDPRPFGSTTTTKLLPRHHHHAKPRRHH